MAPRHARIGGYRRKEVAHHAPRHRIGRLPAEVLPPKVDLRPFLTEVEEQVGSSCVANAFAGAYEYLAKRALGQASDVSRLFVYYNARLIQGDADEDAGTEMDAAIEALKQYGACHESFWPNDEDSITEEPSAEAYGNAEYFKITASEYIETDLEQWRHTLAEGSPIAFALNTFESFDDATERQGRVPMPSRLEAERETDGWHAMLCVGYLDKDQMFIVRNSWGTEWGDQGYCYIPYRYVMHDDHNAHDSWIVKGITELDFDREVWSEDDSSYFSGEGSIQAFDFTCRTDDVEGFSTALESLCEAASTEEGFYFDYEEIERDGSTYAEITNLDIDLSDPEQFEADLHALCTEWAGGDDYDFTLEQADGGDEDDEEEDEGDEDEEDQDDEDDEDEEDEEDGTVEVALSEFYVYTDDADAVVAKVDAVCAEYAASDGEDYSYEYAEDSDDDGDYVSFTEFTVTTADADGFLAALQTACEEAAADGGYNWERS